MGKKQRYYLEQLSNSNGIINYYVLEGQNGRALMIFEKDIFSVLTEKGWHKQSHHDLLKVEIAEDQENVLVYYDKKKQPEKIPIPTVDPDVLILKEEHIDKVIKQMKDDGLTYDDFWEEYYNGINTTYSYDRKKGHYKVTRIDIIALSFYIKEEISVDELKSTLMECASLHELREQGFDV